MSLHYFWNQLTIIKKRKYFLNGEVVQSENPWLIDQLQLTGMFESGTQKKETFCFYNFIQFLCKTFAICCAGNLESNQEVFNWILEQKADQSIELINRDQLIEYIASRDFLAVVFCKYANFKVFAKYEFLQTRQNTSLYYLYLYITQMV